MDDSIDKSGNELNWNNDLIDLIKERLSDEFKNVKVKKGRILKDIFLYNDKNKRNKMQFGFVDQDIVIYHDTLDISAINNNPNFSIHKNDKSDHQQKYLTIPQIICELKYNGISSHGLVLYSEYATNIKSIFPNCKYFLVFRYKGNSTINKLFRHGKYFDRIIAFGDKEVKDGYKKGDFRAQLQDDPELQNKLDEFIDQIKIILHPKETKFIK